MTSESGAVLIEKLKQLEALEGQHDQTVRTKVVEILYGPSTDEQTMTERFRLAAIEFISIEIEQLSS
jgi:hypothetical protein